MAANETAAETPKLKAILFGYLNLSLGLIGLILYLVILVAIRKLKGELKDGFFRVFLSMAVVDICMLTVVSFYTAPVSFSEEQVFGYGRPAVFFGGIQNCFYNVIIMNTVLIAWNRFVSTVLGEYHFNRIFSKKGTSAQIAFTWIYGFAATIGYFYGVAGCYTYQYEKGHYLGVQCGDEKHRHMLYWYSTTNFTLMGITAVLYACILIKLVRLRNTIFNEEIQAERVKSERRLAGQALFIWLALMLNIAAFAPVNAGVWDPQESIPEAMFLQFMVIFNDLANPFIIIGFNKSIRKSIKEIFMGGKDEGKTTKTKSVVTRKTNMALILVEEA